jgi:large subunit ribosomal protein L9
MKLILTQEVPGLGAAGDVVEVKDGYGRNYLLPRSFAMPWTKGGQKQVEALRRARTAREVADLGSAAEVKAALEATVVRLPAKAGAHGRLFGAVTPAHIVEAVRDAGGPLVDRRRIEVGQPIKTVGAHTVTVRVHPDVAATVTLDVVPA